MDVKSGETRVQSEEKNDNKIQVLKIYFIFVLSFFFCCSLVTQEGRNLMSSCSFVARKNCEIQQNQGFQRLFFLISFCIGIIEYYRILLKKMRNIFSKINYLRT